MRMKSLFMTSFALGMIAYGGEARAVCDPVDPIEWNAAGAVFGGGGCSNPATTSVVAAGSQISILFSDIGVTLAGPSDPLLGSKFCSVSIPALKYAGHYWERLHQKIRYGVLKTANARAALNVSSDFFGHSLPDVALDFDMGAVVFEPAGERDAWLDHEEGANPTPWGCTNRDLPGLYNATFVVAAYRANTSEQVNVFMTGDTLQYILSPNPPVPVDCGNGVCEIGENPCCEDCVKDGDGVCCQPPLPGVSEPLEDVCSAPADCGGLPDLSYCGNGICEMCVGESHATCSSDCGGACGDGICDPGEDRCCVDCVADGDGICCDHNNLPFDDVGTSACATIERIETWCNAPLDCGNPAYPGYEWYQNGRPEVCAGVLPFFDGPGTHDHLAPAFGGVGTCGDGVCDLWEHWNPMSTPPHLEGYRCDGTVAGPVDCGPMAPSCN